MIVTRLKLLVAIAAIAAATAVSGAGAPGEAAAVLCPLDSARLWIAAHRDELPRTLTAFRQLTPAYRKAAFAELEPSARVSLWREHLDEATADTALHLSDAQRNAIVLVREQLPELFAAGGESKVQSLERVVKGLFDRRLGTRVFASLGSSRDLLRLPRIPCECNFFSIFGCDEGTGPSGSCEHSMIENCTVMPVGCGFLWLSECDGKCEYPAPGGGGDVPGGPGSGEGAAARD